MLHSLKKGFRPRAKPDYDLRSLCRDNFITLPVDSTVSSAIQKIRRSARKGDIFYLYVTQSGKQLCGVVSIRNLLIAKDDELLSELITQNPVSLLLGTSVGDAYKLFSESRFLSLPLVDEKGTILGVIHATSWWENSAPNAKRSSRKGRGDNFSISWESRRKSKRKVRPKWR